MSYFYLDASALVKRYNVETGSTRVEALTNPLAGHTIILGEITLAEIAAALAAKHGAPDGITREERDRALALFLGHCDTEYDLVVGSRIITEQAVRLTQNHKLRGYDAVQLATALVTNRALTETGLAALTFVAADEDLMTAATAEGLATENPNLHAQAIS